MNDTKSRWALTNWLAAHPLVGLILALAGIGLSIYFYVAGRATRELTISSDPPVTIVRAGQASQIDVLYRGQKINSNVYLREVYIWNAGTDSIRAENILEPIQMVFPGSTILEVRIKSVIRPGVTAFSLAAVPPGGYDSVTPMWKILEHDDGATIDVIYSGKSPGQMGVRGTIEHQAQVRTVEYRAAIALIPPWGRTALALFILLIVPIGIWLLRTISRDLRNTAMPRVQQIALLLILLVSFAAVFVFFGRFAYEQMTDSPPARLMQSLARGE